MPDVGLRLAVTAFGRMGGSIASRLLAAGTPLRLQNRTAEKAAPLLRPGAARAATPREAAAA